MAFKIIKQVTYIYISQKYKIKYSILGKRLFKIKPYKIIIKFQTISCIIFLKMSIKLKNIYFKTQNQIINQNKNQLYKTNNFF